MELQEIILPKSVDGLQLPDPGMLDYFRLAENRIYYIDFEIDMSILDIQREIIYINVVDAEYPIDERIPIKILIDSPGGLLAETMCMCSTIMMSKTPVITVNLCEAYSGGALLLMSGHKRYAMPYSNAMIHTGSGTTSGTFEQTEEQQKLYKRQVDEMGKYILDRTTMDKRVFNKNRSKDWYINAEDQVKYGIVDGVIENLYDILI